MLTALPDPVPGAQFIASTTTPAASPQRGDQVFPIEKRDGGGRVVGCSGFGTFAAAPEAVG
ncbi:hypothetical protein DV701_07325 [Ornithinimicrobium avium]|uniref:Uncharacterized protein n=1 Tax=Ornithinimicrobium avium TaxID=2283195 RepID=A0A345NLP9_9MICO|nr:hypothetical protein DV701_07325 [Ornithinimicrobium avium]